MKKILLVLTFLLVGLSASAELLQKSGAWSLIRNKEKKCTLSSFATSLSGEDLFRKDVFVIMAYDPDLEGFIMSFNVDMSPSSKKHMATLKVGNKTYDLIIDKKRAWNNSTQQSQEIIKSMEDASDMTLRIRKISDNKEVLADRYSLKGFSTMHKVFFSKCKNDLKKS